MDLELLGNWGSHIALGLTGLELLEGETAIKLIPSQIQCSSGNNFLHRLINGKNLTCKPQNMWLMPYDDEKVVITIQFQGIKYVSGRYFERR